VPSPTTGAFEAASRGPRTLFSSPRDAGDERPAQTLCQRQFDRRAGCWRPRRLAGRGPPSAERWPIVMRGWARPQRSCFAGLWCRATGGWTSSAARGA